MSAGVLDPRAAAADPWRPRVVRVLGAREEIAARGATRAVVTLQLERDGLAWRPGQFFEAGVWGAGEIPISISSPSGLDAPVHLTVRAAGTVSSLLARRAPGEAVSLRGPMGNGFPLEAWEGQDLLFVAGGIGLAPLRGLLWEVLLRRERYGRIVLLHGARSPHDLLYPWQWDDWRARGVEMRLAVDRGDGEWERHADPPRIVGFLTTLFPLVDLDPARSVAILCGPPIMIKVSCEELARRRGWPEARLVATLERHMKCGIGKCGHCLVVDRWVCMDGPVFRYDELRAMDRIEPPW
uniref:FAD-binding FR-type domain-containing protein n=1 Tax=Eiseniibacteriota bacterium TaxID=2212470 RepID=A0A832I2Z8_UNCEI